MEIGAQLFTVREYCRTLDDFAETLKKVAEIGYKTVQVSATCPYDGAWLRDRLSENGLKAVLTHVPKEELLGSLDEVLAAHRTFGCAYVGLGYYRFEGTEADYVSFRETWRPVAEKIREGGCYFMYHNHAREFQKIGGKTILKKLAEEFSPEIMGFTFDTYWAQAGGADPAYYLELLAGRIPVIHLKDYGFGQRMEVVGEGNINFDRVFQKAEEGGTKYMMVEQDDCNGEDPFDCLRRSYEYLRSCGFQ